MENENDPSGVVDIIPVTPSADGLLEQQTEQSAEISSEAAAATSAEITSFYTRYELAMKDWTKRTGNTDFPIAVNNGKLRWVNRDERKIHKRAQLKAQRKAAK